MLQCGHNFCSECIRRHLDKEQTCPACRVATSTAQMRRNVALDEIANHFGDCRTRLLKTITDATNTAKRVVTRIDAVGSSSGNAMDVDDFVPQQKRRRVSARVTPLSSQETVDEEMTPRQNPAAHKDDDDDFVVMPAQGSSSAPGGRVLRSRAGRSPTITSATSTTITTTALVPDSPPPQYSQPPSAAQSSTAQQSSGYGQSSAMVSSSSSSTSTSVPTSTSSQNAPITPTRQAKHTLVACPVCEYSVPEAHTNIHLDKYCFKGLTDPIYTLPHSLLMQYTHKPEVIELYERVGMPKAGGTTAPPPSTTTAPTSPSRNQVATNPFAPVQSPFLNGGSSRQTTAVIAKPIPPEMKRLPKLTYSVLNDKQLRKKLQEVGLSTYGDKQQMQKRHAEYVTIYNANCDSTRPMPVSQLLKQMDAWERTYELDIQAKDQQRRQLEQQRATQQRELAQRQAQQGSTTGTPPAAASSPGVAPSSSPSRPFARSSSSSNFVPNQSNNTEVAVAVASASAFAHALKYDAEYKELIADVRKRMKEDRERANESAKKDKEEAAAQFNQSRQSSQSKAAAPVSPNESLSSQSNSSVSSSSSPSSSSQSSIPPQPSTPTQFPRSSSQSSERPTRSLRSIQSNLPMPGAAQAMSPQHSQSSQSGVVAASSSSLVDPSTSQTSMMSSQSSVASHYGSPILSDRESSSAHSSQYSGLPLTPTKLRHPNRPLK
ncbi:E3 ubiquitin-protein ligase rad18 [Gryganskiella cystojenkinii]|nr:E3 ubiquitin-protein ligase rad18 [Gryganskiella cystojenkinii]